MSIWLIMNIKLRCMVSKTSNFDHMYNTVYDKVGEIMKALIMKFSSAFCYLFPLRFTGSLQDPVSDIPSCTFFPLRKRPSFISIQNNIQNCVLYVLIFRILLLADAKTKYSEPNGTKHSCNLICLPFLCENKFKCGLRMTKYLNDK